LGWQYPNLLLCGGGRGQRVPVAPGVSGIRFPQPPGVARKGPGVVYCRLFYLFDKTWDLSKTFITFATPKKVLYSPAKAGLRNLGDQVIRPLAVKDRLNQ